MNLSGNYLSGNINISAAELCTEYHLTTPIGIDNLTICDCNPDDPANKNATYECDYNSNCTVACPDNTIYNLGCNKYGQKIFYGPPSNIDNISDGNYILIGNLNLTSNTLIQNTTLYISDNLVVLPGTILNLKNSNVLIDGNLILSNGSTIVLGNGTNVSVLGCIVINGAILQTTVPAELENQTSGSWIVLYANCSMGVFGKNILQNDGSPFKDDPNCDFESDVVQTLTTVNIQFSYVCQEPGGLPLGLIIGLAVGIPVLMCILAVVILKNERLRKEFLPYRASKSDDDSIEIGPSE